MTNTPPASSTTSATSTIDPNVLAAAIAAALAQLQTTAAATAPAAVSRSLPPVPQYVHDPAKPNGASIWFERIENIMDLHNVTGKEKVQLTVNALDTSTYEKVSRAILPATLLGYADFDNLKKVMIQQFDYTTSLFAKRYAAFHIVWKGPEHESIAEYGSRVRQQITNCDPSNFTQTEMETMVLLMGMREPGLDGFRTQVLSLLNADPATTLDKCLTTMTAAYQTQREQKLPTSTSVNFVKQSHQRQQPTRPFKKGGKKHGGPSQSSCGSCGAAHDRSTCKFRDAVCRYCQNKGHIEKVCRKKKTDGDRGDSNKDGSTQCSRRSHQSSKQIHNVGAFNVLSFSTLSNGDAYVPPHMVQVQVNGATITGQLDDGADVSLISRHDYEHIGSPALVGVASTARAANNEEFPLHGSFTVEAVLHGRKEHITMHLANIATTLFGRTFFKTFGLDKIPLADVICNLVVSESIAPAGYVDQLLEEFKPLFKPGLGCCTKRKIHLYLKKDVTPIHIPARRPSMHADGIIKEEVQRLKNQGVAYPVASSPWAFPCSVVPKKDGRHRFIVDFSRGLNERLEEPNYTLPLPETIFARLAGCRVFTVLDFSDAYHQMELDEESQQFVTISTPNGLIRFRRMPQGLKNAPSDFQEVMEDMLNDKACAGPYLDDVIIASSDIESHMADLKSVLARIMDWGFRLNPKKCKFFRSSVRFLGKIVDARGIRPDPEKVRAIQHMPEPTDVSTLRSFLGMVNYYQSFIPSFRDLREPLDDLLKKDAEWIWSSKQKTSVQKIKAQLTQECLLTHYDPRLPIIVAADASQAGIGGVISHQYPDGTERPIQFFSRALDTTQRKYSQTEKEGLALVMAIKTFHRYLEGRKFTLLTDHKALLSIFGKKTSVPILAANRLHRWAIFLASYNFDIQYRRTTEFGQADAVSRLIAETRSIPELFEEELEMDEFVAAQTLIKHVSILPVTAEDIQKAYDDDDFAKEIRRSLLKDSADTRFSEVKGIIMMQNRVYIPVALRTRVLEQLHAGHSGITATKQLARNHVYWPRITKDIENTVKSCFYCMQSTKMPVKTHLSSWPRSMNPGDRVHIDFAGPLLDHMLLVIVDSYSKWIDVGVLKTATTKTTLGVLSKYISDNGAPRVLVSDNGRQFISEEFEYFCRVRGIKHMCSPAYHPQSNGQAERSVDIVKRFVKKCAMSHGPGMNMEECVQAFLLQYRTTPSTATPGGVTPAMAHVGRELRTNLDLLRPQFVKNLGPDEEMEKQFDSQYGTKLRYFQVHDPVFARKGKNNEWFEGTVAQKLGSCMYVIRDIHGKTHRMHANQIYKRHIPVSYDFDLNGTPSVTSDDTQSVTSSTSAVSQRQTATTPRRS